MGVLLVRAAGVEPTTYGFGGRHSIQLSYARAQSEPRNAVRRLTMPLVSGRASSFVTD